MYQIQFGSPIHVHFIGIGGISMSSLAEILLARNFMISGSDQKASELTRHLEAKGARIAIGQRADGTLILLVTDGRTASSLGATHDEVIDMMVSLGAITAGMLDGGSSTMLYYENYYKKYNIKALIGQT